MHIAKIKVSGQVQGVFFRHNTCQKAAELNIAGYVSNLDDGSVFITAQGEKEGLEKLLAWIKTSPGQSKVKEVKAEWGKTELDNLTGFRIRYE